jgi:hypothetical protein
MGSIVLVKSNFKMIIFDPGPNKTPQPIEAETWTLDYVNEVIMVA